MFIEKPEKPEHFRYIAPDRRQKSSVYIGIMQRQQAMAFLPNQDILLCRNLLQPNHRPILRNYKATTNVLSLSLITWENC